ncbi:MAG: hypothetical protein H6714_03160 [Myxococcales bacterium]|nr:hypothetical protein [Myxococcales bacterium]
MMYVRIHWIIGFAVSLGLFGGRASASEVTGRLVIAPQLLTASQPRNCPERSCYWNEPNGVDALRAYRFRPSRYITVVLRSSRQAPKSQVMLLHGGGFLPGTMVVGKGASLIVSNSDGFQRSPYAKGLPALDFALLSPGESRTTSLDTQGHWALTDRMLPQAQGDLHVIGDLAAVATLDDDGTFRFSDVDAGRYTLSVYYRDGVRTSQDVTVPGKGQLKVDPITLSTAKPR